MIKKIKNCQLAIGDESLKNLKRCPKTTFLLNPFTITLSKSTLSFTILSIIGHTKLTFLKSGYNMIGNSRKTVFLELQDFRKNI